MRIFVFCSLLLAFASCGTNEKPPKAKEISIDKLITMYPDSVPILIRHGNALMERYDYNNALRDGAKAFRLDSSNIEARMLYASALNNRADRSVTDVMTAQRHFLYVIRKQPKNMAALVALAATYAQQGDNERAFYYINEALRIDKRYRDAYVLKGSIYLSMNNRKLAKSSYQTAIDQDPDFFEAYIALGDLHLQDGERICLEYYTTAVELRPNSMDAMYSLAYGYQQFNESEKALAIYRKMLRQESTFSMADFQQGWIKQFQQNDRDSAMFFYNVALQKEPRFVEAWHNLGLCYEEEGNRSLALQSYSKALQYDPEFELSRKAADKLR
jgi:tetratricopeptide (TPR) repeat protein